MKIVRRGALPVGGDSGLDFIAALSQRKFDEADVHFMEVLAAVLADDGVVAAFPAERPLHHRRLVVGARRLEDAAFPPAFAEPSVFWRFAVAIRQ